MLSQTPATVPVSNSKVCLPDVFCFLPCCSATPCTDLAEGFVGEVTGG